MCRQEGLLTDLHQNDADYQGDFCIRADVFFKGVSVGLNFFMKMRMPFWAWKEGGRRDNI